MKILATLRKEKGLTQSDAAEAISVGLRMYQHYEGGTKNVPKKSLDKLSELFEVPISYFYLNEEGDTKYLIPKREINLTSMEEVSLFVAENIDEMRNNPVISLLIKNEVLKDENEMLKEKIKELKKNTI